MHIREETPSDAAAISDIIRAAFERQHEARIVDRLRADGDMVLSLVGFEDDTLVAHIGFSRMFIDDGRDKWPAVGLAPLSVLPARQNKGLGSAITRRGIELCRAQGHERLFVLGDPAYYGRFGFTPAYTYTIAGTFAQDDSFMALALRAGAFKGIIGVAHYAPAFGPGA